MTRRRQVLKHLGVALTGLGGCYTQTRRQTETHTETNTGNGTEIDGTPTPSDRSRLEGRFGTVHNVVEEGVDDTGELYVDDQIHGLAGDDTLLYFPSGTYRIGGLRFRNLSNFGLLGDDATFRIGTRGRSVSLGFQHVSDVHVEGFTLDNSVANTAAWCDFKCVGGSNVIRNYSVTDFVDVDERTNGFTLMVEGADTDLTLENVDLRHGARNGAAAFVFPQREFYDPNDEPGALEFRNCVMNGWGKEGLYASAHGGPLRVIGGEYANNAIVQVRVGGGNAGTEAIVRDVTVRVTEIPDYTPDGNRIFRGIWLKEGDECLVEGCTVDISGVGPNQTQGAIVVNNQFGRATIRDCDLTTNVQRPAIAANNPVSEYRPGPMPSMDRLPEEWSVTCENVMISGESPNTPAVEIHRREGCTLSDITIDKTGQASDGVQLYESADCRIDTSSVTVSRFPLVVDFARDDSGCVCRLDSTSLEATDLDHGGAELVSAEDGVFCIDAAALGGDTSSADRSTLALTRTGVPSTQSDQSDVAPVSAGSPQQVRALVNQDNDEQTLYGRWVPDS
jgi:hypothetical protein